MSDPKRVQFPTFAERADPEYQAPPAGPPRPDGARPGFRTWYAGRPNRCGGASVNNKRTKCDAEAEENQGLCRECAGIERENRARAIREFQAPKEQESSGRKAFK